MDSRVTASMIHLLFNPAHPAHVKYVEKHPQPTSEIFSGVLLGGGPLPSSEKPAQVSALLEVFANHLGRFNRHDAYLELDFLSDLLQLADEDIMRGVLKCDVLWKNMIGLMKRSHAPDTPDPKQDTPGIAVIPYCISIISQTINIASGRDREYLVRVCLEAGFFNVLDEVVASIEIMERRGDVCSTSNVFPSVTFLSFYSSLT